MIREGVATLLNSILGVEEVPFNVPPKREFGDFSSAVCLSLAKQKRQSPMKIAQETADQLREKSPPYILEITVSPPGYLNFKVDWVGLARDLMTQIFKEGDLFGKSAAVQEEKIFIEHTSVNPNKAMHIGHLRNAVIGDTVARVLKWLGFPTEVCNYIDDTGVQVVDVVTAFLYLDPPFYSEGSFDFRSFWAKAPGEQPLDYFCWDLYARFQTEVESNSSLQERRDEVLHKIERGTHPIAVFAKELATRMVQPIWRRWRNFRSSMISSTGNPISSGGASGKRPSNS
jgi:arginyl-tRNA synthetase